MVRELDFQGGYDETKLPPQNIEAEEAILGGILLDPEAINRVTELLSAEAFYIQAHQIIYQAAQGLHAQGQPTDLISVTAWLHDREQLDKVGGRSKLAQLVDRTVSAVNIDQYAALVMDKYFRRQLIQAGQEINGLGYDTTQPLETVLDLAEQKIFNITQKRPQQDLVPIFETLIQTFQDIEIQHETQAQPGILSGFYDLDAMTGGFQPSDLIIVAGRPSMGKCLHGRSQLLLSDGRLMSIEQVYRRSVAETSQVPELFTLGNDWRFHRTQPSDFLDDGVKPVFRVTTRLGRQVETTLTHPYLTRTGWRSLAALNVGDKIAVPRRLAVFGDRTLSDSRIRVLAEEVSRSQQISEIVFQLKKSNLAKFLHCLFSQNGWATISESEKAVFSQIGYSTSCETVARQVQHLLLRFGILASLQFQGEIWQLSICHLESIQVFFEEIGAVENCLGSALIPQPLLPSLGEGEIGDLLEFRCNSIACDTNTLVGANRRSPRRQQFRDFIHSTYSPNSNRAETCQIESVFGVNLLSKNSDFVNTKNGNNRSKLAVVQNPWFGENGGFRRWERWRDEDRETGEVYWDEIVAIEYIGNHPVYDLTIPETHNFIANDICVHNTAVSLNFAHNIANAYRVPVAIFSLEMSKEQLVQRLLASEAGIESNRLRAGRVSQTEWEPLSRALASLSEIPLFIDDTPNITVTEMRSKCRRLQAEQGQPLGLVLLDYLQLMEGSGDNRVQELSRITRSLKGLSRELNVPVIALSQLSRGVEARTNKRPMMSDLRESGCLAGDSLVTLADTGERVPIRDLVGRSGFAVWALNEETFKLERAIVSRAFSTGVKPIFRLTTRLGRTIRATGNHKFRSIGGWKRLDEFAIGDRVALPRIVPNSSQSSMKDEELALLGHLVGDGCTLPRHVIQYTTKDLDLAEIVCDLAATLFQDRISPRIQYEQSWYQVYLPAREHLTHKVRNPISVWLDDLGVFGLRSYQKLVPSLVFCQSEASISKFLKHLWSTDGCINLLKGKSPRPIAYYSTSSYRLALDVQSLLLKLGINARLSCKPQKGKGRDQYHVTITGKPGIERFIRLIGAVGVKKQTALLEIAEHLEHRSNNPNCDVIPKEIWRAYAVPAMQSTGLTNRQMQAQLGVSYCGTSLYKNNLSRERAYRLGKIVNSSEILSLSTSDVYWDDIVSIEPEGDTEVYDLTVPGHHNFVADNIIVHNSIEQDADLIVMLYRDEYYFPDTPDRGITEMIIAKHRNGPTGVVKLLFDPQYTRFRNLATPNRPISGSSFTPLPPG
ncbi:replicative DNA helicase [Baaleninema sp.]|uniref:replicative DNA helicase n=1 Tax=Baaleninema sp. TaxID=3101197 RepID=UPI003D040801